MDLICREAWINSNKIATWWPSMLTIAILRIHLKDNCRATDQSSTIHQHSQKVPTTASHSTKGFWVQIESTHLVTRITVIQWYLKPWYCQRVHLVSTTNLNSSLSNRDECSRMKIWIRSVITKEMREISICIIWIISIKMGLQLAGSHSSSRIGKYLSLRNLRALGHLDILPVVFTRHKKSVSNSYNKLINNSNREVSPSEFMRWLMRMIGKFWWARMMVIICLAPGLLKKYRSNII